jgi:hypothetical protein
MRLSGLAVALVLFVGLTAFGARAQTASTTPLPGASAPAAKPEKRPATPAEMRDSATAPGDLRPERRVTPQLSIPLTPNASPKPVLTPTPKGTTGPSGGVDDSVARCNAMADAQARDACHAKLGR